MLKTYLLILITFSLFSCSSMPFSKNKAGPDTGNTNKTHTIQQKDKTEMVEQVEESEPKPGDIKVVNGIEYIYVSNRKYMLTAFEPEYVWERKDQYAPRIGEHLLSDRSSEKERKAMEDRITKLEEDLKKKGMAPQTAYPVQTTPLPLQTTANMPVIMPSPNLSSPKIKRRIIVLPMTDERHYKNGHLCEAATAILTSKLENTNTIICVDPVTLNIKGQLTDPENMAMLNEVHGIQAVLKGTLSDAAADANHAAFAINIFLYDTETGAVLKQFSEKSSVSSLKKNGGLTLEEAKIGSLNTSMELVAANLQRSLLTIEWHARIASIENGKIYINAGRLSGIEDGAALDVYSPGVRIYDTKTKTPLGKIKGIHKGELKVSGLFGVDASLARPVKGGNFSVSDLVYVK